MKTFYNILNIDEEFMNFVGNNEEKYYLSYKKVKKSGGYRWIDVPAAELKEAQRIILEKLFYTYSNFNKVVQGFTKNRDAVTNATVHKNCKKFLTMDLHDFFGTVTKTHLYGLLVKVIYKFCKSNDVTYESKYVKQILNMCLFYNRLPQGAPTSPFLANLAFKKCDDQILTFVSNFNLLYTRYADDLTISSNDRDFDFKELSSDIHNIIKNNRFFVNNKKTRILHEGKAMNITGVIINNNKLSVKKTYLNNLRAELHNLSKTNPIQEDLQKVKGKIAWVEKVQKSKVQKLTQKYTKLLNS